MKAQIIYRRSRDEEERIKAAVHCFRNRIEMKGALSLHEHTESLAEPASLRSLIIRRVVAVGCVLRIVEVAAALTSGDELIWLGRRR